MVTEIYFFVCLFFFPFSLLFSFHKCKKFITFGNLDVFSGAQKMKRRMKTGFLWFCFVMLARQVQALMF
ncbi:uncharacterized protein DS421_3g103920 [Arachis hypogaea]|nr:uncharacterized protein DS421_3g103920 [Arachis hypogaea]